MTTGMLNPGAEDQGLVAAVAVIVPEVTATGIVPPDDATITNGALESEVTVVPPDVATITSGALLN